MLLPLGPIAAALPWIVVPLVTVARVRDSRVLAPVPDDAAAPDAPLVSVIVPARDEARNIGACLAHILASRGVALEVIVADDHSTDGTGAIAREIAARDARVHVVESPPLPAGWFGKQWACRTGAAAASGEILLFVDADARVGPALIARSLRTLTEEHADLLSVGGRQAMGTLWERLVQPQVFRVLAQRYGGTETVNRSRRTADKIANGQYLMLRRAPYDALGGHALVRGDVAEDLMLAQRYHAAGRRTVLRLAWDQLSTRMYTSLGELVRGWGKNVYAGGRDAMPGGRVGQLVFPILLLLPALWQLVPVAALVLGALGVVPTGVLLWSAIAVAAELVWWTFVYRMERLGIWHALLFPVGAALLLYICATAIARGRRVAWKGREYVSGTPAAGGA